MTALPTPIPSTSSRVPPLSKIQHIVFDYCCLSLPLDQLAEKHSLSFRQLDDLLNTPEALAEIEAARAIAAKRAAFTLDTILPHAIERLVATLEDDHANPETRRKAATALIRLHQQAQRVNADSSLCSEPRGSPRAAPSRQRDPASTANPAKADEALPLCRVIQRACSPANSSPPHPTVPDSAAAADGPGDHGRPLFLDMSVQQPIACADAVACSGGR